MTTATVTKIEPFRVVHEGVLLRPKPEHSDPSDSRLDHDVRGSVAFLPSRNEHVARWQTPMGHAYGNFDISTNLLKSNGWVVMPVDWASKLREAEERHGTIAFAVDPIVEEIVRFQMSFPNICQLLKLDTRPRDSLVSPGQIFISKRPTGVDWSCYIERHLAGDFGICGLYVPTPLSAEQVWSFGLQAPNVVNSEGARRRMVVKSEYVLSPEETAAVRPTLAIREWKPPNVHVLTFCGRKTLAYADAPTT